MNQLQRLILTVLLPFEDFAPATCLCFRVIAGIATLLGS